MTIQKISNAILYTLTLPILFVILFLLFPKEINAKSSNFVNCYNSINDVQNTDLSVGQTVKTLGYNTANDNGGASYLITNTPSYLVDNIYVIPLTNGNYAQMIIPDNSIINVACAGITPNTRISQQLNQLIQSSVGKVNSIQFNNGNYILDQTVYLESLSYYGSGDTTLSVDKFFSTKYDKILLTSQEANRSFNINFENINFIFETSSDHALHDYSEVVFLALHNINSCNISNCHMLATPASTNGDFMAIDLLWFRFSDFHKNITISNSSFKNETGIIYAGCKDKLLTGGCLWFTGKSSNSIIQNIKVHNSLFETTSNDEAIAMWDGDFREITFENCDINTHSHNCDNAITCYNGSFNKVVFQKTNINLLAQTIYAFKSFGITRDSYISFLNCSIKASSIKNDDNISIFQTGKSIYPYTVEIKNCDIFLDSNTSYRNILGSHATTNFKYDIQDCTIDGKCTYGFTFLYDTQLASLNCVSNTINTYGSLLYLYNANSCSLNISSNTIKSKATTTVNQSGDFNYSLTGNTFLNPGVIINLYQVQSVNTMSHLNISSNKIFSTKELIMCTSNTSINCKDFMQISE